MPSLRQSPFRQSSLCRRVSCAPATALAGCLAAALTLSAPGIAAASLGGAGMKVATGCLRSREVLKLPDGIKLSDLKADGKVALERVVVCVERAPACSAQDPLSALCVAG